MAQAEQLGEAAALLETQALPLPAHAARRLRWDAALQLLTAVLANDPAGVAAALAAGERIDKLDDRGMSALMHAAHQGLAAMVELVLQKATEAYASRRARWAPTARRTRARHSGRPGVARLRETARLQWADRPHVRVPRGARRGAAAVLEGAARAMGPSLALPLVAPRTTRR